MKFSLLAGFVFALLTLSGCITAPSPEELKNAHYGAYPSTYLSKLDPVLDDLHQQLGDPFQVLNISRPHKDWLGGGGNRLWAYSVLVLFKAPNGGPGAPPVIFRNKYYFVNGKIAATVMVPNFGDLAGVTNGDTVSAEDNYPVGGNYQN